MNINIKAILTGIAIVILSIIVSEIVFGTFSVWSFLVSFIIGAIVTILLIAQSRSEKPEDIVQEVVQQAVNPNPNAIQDKVEEQLIRLNENLRLNCKSYKVITATEKVIDLLLEVVPRALKESPNSEATFNLEMLSTNYLQDFITDYLKLSDKDQESLEEEILKQIGELKENINKAKSSLDEGNLDDFKVSSSFLKAKTA